MARPVLTASLSNQRDSLGVLQSLHIIVRPFELVSIDIVGPFPKDSGGGVLIDYATQYPKAIALSSTTAPELARELATSFSQVGILC